MDTQKTASIAEQDMTWLKTRYPDFASHRPDKLESMRQEAHQYTQIVRLLFCMTFELFVAMIAIMLISAFAPTLSLLGSLIIAVLACMLVWPLQKVLNRQIYRSQWVRNLKAA
ncbi:hypothetical protein BFW38_07900 [Terasakiispira papahanaumokuakeensis]|uniref:Uncharacterized protein n=1 Tax=Terasakiispira papahanaumokuakeensis TaxID=197479 RepID=A0A1E2V8Z0_9GAMM|nr:hypothetical protein [Terasakiispira papahanaumokuakeensis]ODC03479.1 hypothetical protein BFW38_07900 [Terasakiispira papahanaumokuakeensis]